MICAVARVASRHVVIAFASDYGHADEFVGVCKAVMLGHRARRPDHRPRATTSPPTTCARARSSSCGRSSTCPTDCIVVAVVDPGVGTDRRLLGVEVEGGVLLGPDNGLLAPAVAMVGGARPGGRARRTPTTSSPAPGPDVRRARHPRARGRAPRRRAPRSPTSGPSRPRGPGARPRVAARAARRRRDRRRGVVGRPVRELPAQRRPRRARSRRAPRRAARVEVRLRTARSGPPGGCTPTPTPSRRSWCCSSTPTACCRSPSTGSRPPRRSASRPGAASPCVPEGASLSLTIGHAEQP